MNTIISVRKLVFFVLVMSLSLFVAKDAFAALQANPTNFRYDAPTFMASHIIDVGGTVESDTFTLIENGGAYPAPYVITPSAAWISTDPAAGTLTAEAPTQDVTINYDTDELAAGTYAGTLTIGPQTINITIKIVEPIVSVWRTDEGAGGADSYPEANDDMVFDRPRGAVDEFGVPVYSAPTNDILPVIEAFGAWSGKGAPYQLPGLPPIGTEFAPTAAPNTFNLWNIGSGTLEFRVVSVDFIEGDGWLTKIQSDYGGADTLLWDVTHGPATGAESPFYPDTILDSVDAGGAQNAKNLIGVTYSTTSMDTGTYQAKITMTARSSDTETVAQYSEKLIIWVILRIGCKAYCAGSSGYVADLAVGTGAVLPVVAEFAGDDPADDYFTLYNSSYRTPSDEWRPTWCPDNTGNPPTTDFPAANNSNALTYHITKGGDLDGTWFTLHTKDGFLDPAGDSDQINISFDITDLYPGGYTGYIFVEGNDGFGEDASNTVFTNPGANPTFSVDPLNDGNFVRLDMTVVGPTIGLSTNSMKQYLLEGTTAASEPIYIWNRYAIRSHLHFDYTITDDDTGTTADWLSMTLTDYAGNPNPSQIVGPYDDPGEPGTDNRDIITLNYDASGLRPGTYNATMKIFGDKDPDGNEICENSPQYIHISLEVYGPYITTDVSDLNPSCIINTNADTDNTFKVWNADEAIPAITYPGSTLNYSIVTDQDWLTCDPVSGDSTGPADKDTITVSYNTANLDAGVHTANITIKNELNGHTRVLNVTLTVSAPVIATSTEEIVVSTDYGVNPDPVDFELWNSDTSGTTLTYTLSDDVDWLSLTDVTGQPLISTGPGDRRTVTVNFDAASMEAGKYTATITIGGNGEATDKTISVDLEIKAAIVTVEPLALYPTCLVGNDAAADTFEVWNGSGFATLNFSTSITYIEDTGGINWISLNPTTGTSEDATDKQTVTVTYDTDQLSAGTYTATIKVSDPDSSNQSETINIVLVVQNPVISLSKSELTATTEVGNSPSNQTFQVWNSNSGTLYYAVTDDVGWLACQDSTPVVNPTGDSSGEKDTITVVYATGALSIGTHTATITVNGYKDVARTIPTDTPTQTIAVTVKVGAVIEVNESTVTASAYQGSNPDPGTFKVRNGGATGTTLNYSIADDVDWLSCSPTPGTSTGEWDTITITYATTTLAPAVYTGTITVTNTDEATDTQQVTVTLTILSGAQIALDPGTIDVETAEGSDAPSDTFVVYNNGIGTLNYTITDDVAWLSCSPTTGDSSGIADKDTITITYATSGLTKGDYTGTITVTDPLAENSPQTITVSLSLLGPTIAKDKTSISAKSDVGASVTDTFQVWNSGGGTLNYTITSDQSWLTTSPTSGDSTGAADVDVITVTMDSAGLSAGTYTGTITISDPSATVTSETISVTYDVGIPEINTSVTELTPTAVEDNDADNDTFQISNSGSGTLNYTITDDAEWLTCSPTSGDSTGASDIDTITVSYSTKTMDVGEHTATITITDTEASNSPFTIAVTLTITEDLPKDQLLANLINSSDGVTRNADGEVTFWPDQSTSNNNAFQEKTSASPIFVPNVLDNNSSLLFNGKSAMDIKSGQGINLGGPFTAKSVAMAFKTGEDVNTRQVLFSQGSSTHGLNIYIDQGNLYMNIWNFDPSIWTSYVSTSIAADTAYTIIMIFDQSSDTLSGYLDGTLFATASGLGSLYNDEHGITIGNADRKGKTYFHDASKKKASGFMGYIAQFIYYNSALDSEGVRKVLLNLNATYNFTSLALWLRTDTGVEQKIDGYVKQWNNKANVSSTGRRKAKIVVFKQGSKKKQPAYKTDVVSTIAGVEFNGTSSYLKAKSHELINSNRKEAYDARTIFVVFKPDNATSQQILWAEGDKKSGMNIYLSSQQLNVGVWSYKANSRQGITAWGSAFLAGGTIQADTATCAQLTLDNSNFAGYLDGASIGSSTSAGAIGKHGPAVLGAIVRGTYLDDSGWVKKGSYLDGSILEVLLYNSALTASQVSDVEAYIRSRYSIVFE